MRSCILLFALVFVVAEVKGDSFLQEIIQLDRTCRKESGITAEDFGELFEYNVPTSAKCYLKCLMDQFGIWNNGLDVKAFMSKVRKVPLLTLLGSKIQKVLNQCTDVDGEDDCEKAFNVGICLAATVYKDYGDLIHSAYKLAKS